MSFSLLIRPVIFTGAVCCTCFCGAAIGQYENKKKPFTFHNNWRTFSQKKTLDFRQKILEWKSNLKTGDKISAGVIIINTLVFVCWKLKRTQPFLNKYFLSQISDKNIKLSPMILSNFSHHTPLHLAVNMFVISSFSNNATYLLGPEQLIALYLSAGVVSSLASLAYRLSINRAIPSLGASGAILGVIAYICMTSPDQKVLLFFIPMTAGLALKCIAGFDLAGLIARWGILDHAAHLGGTLTGVWYATYGEKLFYKHKKTIIHRWNQISRGI